MNFQILYNLKDHDKIDMSKVSYEEFKNQFFSFQILFEEEEELLSDIPLDEILNILHQESMEYYLVGRLKKITKKVALNSRDIFFVSLIAFAQKFLSDTIGKEEVSEGHLPNILQSWNLERAEVVGDGNCLFRAVACSLLLQISNGNNVVRVLSSLGANTDHLNEFVSAAIFA